MLQSDSARTYLQLLQTCPVTAMGRQQCSPRSVVQVKGNIAKNTIAVMGLQICSGHLAYIHSVTNVQAVLPFYDVKCLYLFYGTQAFYIIKRQNCLNICNTVYIFLRMRQEIVTSERISPHILGERETFACMVHITPK